VRRGAGAAKEEIEQFERIFAVDHQQRLAAARVHRQRHPACQPVGAFCAVIGEALNRERLGPDPDLMTQQRLEHPAQTPRKPRREMLQRVQIAERIEVRTPQRSGMLCHRAGTFAPVRVGSR
jgi:hypothetical protein